MIHRLFSEPISAENSVALDLSDANVELTPSIYGSINEFCDYIDSTLGSKIGFGGYLEHRHIYQSHENFATDSAAFRNIHLGIDFWTSAGTAVHAPMDGEVHSFQINEGSGNYGPTIILFHPKEKIYSLYGHLQSSDLNHLEIGKPIFTGQIFCHLGKPNENGGWPPHLHFQLIRDMQGFHGDYPGVCSQKDVTMYMQNCPDPASFFR